MLYKFYNRIFQLLMRIYNRLNILYLIIFNQKRLIKSRVACFGKDIFSIVFKDSNYILVNQQKARIDLIVDFDNNKKLKPKVNRIKKFIHRPDVFSLIKEQQRFYWSKIKNENFVLMDSYSELTDQKFIHKKNHWCFCCHYKDIDHNQFFQNDFNEEGLLQLDKIKEYYEIFFYNHFHDNPQQKIYFINYSSKFDNREKFQERSRVIFETIEYFTKKYPKLYNIYINEEYFFKNEIDDFPYHYSQKTNLIMAEKFNEIFYKLK